MNDTVEKDPAAAKPVAKKTSFSARNLQLPPAPIIDAPPAVLADEVGIAQAADVLRGGGLVAFPTETVYGLGADASNPAAVAKIFKAKGRPESHPLIVHIADVDELSKWARDVPETAKTLARAFWPGPLTIVLKRAAGVPDVVTGGQDTIALRVPAHPKALELLRAFDGGVAAPSANKFGRISPTQPDHVRLDLGREVDLVLDGGNCDVGIESTIVDLSGAHPVLLRPGRVSAVEMETLLGEPVLAPDAQSPRAPGSHESHYAPRAAMKIVPNRRDFTDELTAHRGRRIAILALEISVPRVPAPLQRVLVASAAEYSRHLYAKMRELDHTGADLILVEAPPKGGHWDSVWDRLRRAEHEHALGAKTWKGEPPWKKKAVMDDADGEAPAAPQPE
jgi:L-threonylcarbamoyladenylate synthase